MHFWKMDLIRGQRYRFQTRDNRVHQIGRFVGVDGNNNYIFNVNGIITAYHMNALLGMQPRASGIGFDDMFVRDDGPIGGKMHGSKSRNRSRIRNRNRNRKSRKNSKK